MASPFFVQEINSTPKCCQQPFAHFVSFSTLHCFRCTPHVKISFCHTDCLEYTCKRSVIHASVINCAPPPFFFSVCATLGGIIGSKHICVFLPLVKITVQFLKCINVIHRLRMINSALQTNVQCCCMSQKAGHYSFFPRILKETLLLEAYVC